MSAWTTQAGLLGGCEPSRARIHLPEGFEYTYAEVGNGSSKSTAGVKIELADTYAQFNVLHMNQDGVIR